MITLGRRITEDGFISYNSNEHSVPEGLVHSEVNLRATLEGLHIFQDGQLVARHPALEGRGGIMTELEGMQRSAAENAESDFVLRLRCGPG